MGGVASTATTIFVRVKGIEPPYSPRENHLTLGDRDSPIVAVLWLLQFQETVTTLLLEKKRVLLHHFWKYTKATARYIISGFSQKACLGLHPFTPPPLTERTAWKCCNFSFSLTMIQHLKVSCVTQRRIELRSPGWKPGVLVHYTIGS